jgi:hypothetical protein
MCAITQKPSALPIVLGIWVIFDLFIVILTVYNALEQPRRNQVEVMTTLQHDGAKMFAVSVHHRRRLYLTKPSSVPFMHVDFILLEVTYAYLQLVLRLGNLIVAIVGDVCFSFILSRKCTYQTS